MSPEELKARDTWVVEIKRPVLDAFLRTLNRNLVLDAYGRRLSFSVEYDEDARKSVITIHCINFGRP